MTPPSFVKPNSINAEWVQEDPSVVVTPPRSGHVGWISPNNDIHIFGGYAEEWDTTDDYGDGDNKQNILVPNRYVTNDLWKFSSSDKTWTDMSSKQSGDIPQTRLASACSVLQSEDDNNHHSLLLIGGWDPQTAGTGGVILDDIHELNLSTLKWSKLPIKVPDGPTSRHVAVTIENKAPNGKFQKRILIHNHRCTDHVLLLSKDDDGKWTIHKQSTKGTSPSPRGLHAAQTFDHGTKVLFFGGAAQSGQMTNDVHVLDCKTWTWSEVKCSSVIDNASPNNEILVPSPRASPCLAKLDEDNNSEVCINDDTAQSHYNQFVLFGGAGRSMGGGEVDEGGLVGFNDTWILHLQQTDSSYLAWWEKLHCNTTIRTSQPPGRNAATMFTLSNQNDHHDTTSSTSASRSFLLQGGWTPFKKTYNDNFILKLSQHY